MNASNEQIYGVPNGCGIYVSGVIPGSSADYAGIRQGDFILAADGKWLNSAWTLDDAKGYHNAGDDMTLLVIVNGKRMNCVVGVRASQ